MAPSYNPTARFAGLFAAWLILSGFGGPAHEGWVLQSEEKLQEALEKYKKAQEEDPESRALDYNMGGTYHNLGQYQEAVKALDRASASEDPSISKTALFNRAVSLFRSGEAAQGSGGEELAQKLFQESAMGFKNLLKADRNDKDSRHNLELALSRIKEIEDRKKRGESRQSQDEKDKNADSEEKGDKGRENKDKDQKHSEGQKENNKPREQEKKSSQEKDEMEQNQEMTPEEARQTLDALERDEMELKKSIRQKMIPPSQRPEKDW